MSSTRELALELGYLVKIAWNSVAERGVLQTLRQGPKYVATYLRRREAWQNFDDADGFDKRYGTDTSSSLGHANFDVDSQQLLRATPSRATRPRTFQRIIQAMDIKHEDYVFIDFGSGKGRIVMLAAQLPFKKIIGVELSPKLHAVAQKNVEIFRSKTGCGDNIELACADATSYPLPPDNTVCYFFDPFELPVISAVIENLRQSLQKRPHKMFIAYVNPTYCAAMDRSGFLERIRSSAGGAPETHQEYPWLLYTNKLV